MLSLQVTHSASQRLAIASTCGKSQGLSDLPSSSRKYFSSVELGEQEGDLVAAGAASGRRGCGCCVSPTIGAFSVFVGMSAVVRASLRFVGRTSAVSRSPGSS